MTNTFCCSNCPGLIAVAMIGAIVLTLRNAAMSNEERGFDQ